MTTLGHWITNREEECAEKIEQIFIEPYEEGPNEKKRLLTRTQFLEDPWWTKPFSPGYGRAGCPPLVAWSKNWIFYVHEYDGSTALHRLPRNPTFMAAAVFYGDVS